MLFGVLFFFKNLFLFLLFLDSSNGVDRNECVVCQDRDVKRSKCRIFTWEDLKVSRSVAEEIFGDRCFDDQKILYICDRCSTDIRNVGKKGARQDVSTNFVCTCCHKNSQWRKEFVCFLRENYDFNHPVIKEALSAEVRKRNQRKEFICKLCHNCLKKSTKNREPQVPKNAKCLEISWKIQKGNKMYVRNNWHCIIQKLQKCRTYQELETKVKELETEEHISVKWNRLMSSDKKDIIAQSLIPEDCVLNDAVAVYSSPDGSCFFNSLSRLCYGNEMHAEEIRVRTIIEAVRNKSSYLDHNYLCRYHHVGHSRDAHLADIYMALGNQNLQGLGLEQFYEGEVLQLCGSGTYAGVWQFHQAANVINTPIQGIFPSGANSHVRQELNRKFFPMKVQERSSFVCIMWTKTHASLSLPNHFVPLIR